MNEAENLMRFLMTASSLEKKLQELKSSYMSASNLNGADLPVFLALVLGGRPMTFSEITAEASLDKAQVSRALSRLIERQLIVRPKEKKRSAPYQLSDRGRSFADALCLASSRLVDQAHADISLDQWEFYYQFHAQLMDFLNREAPNLIQDAGGSGMSSSAVQLKNNETEM